VVDEVNESIADVVVDRDYDVGSKMACGCRVSRCRRSLVCNFLLPHTMSDQHT